MPAAAISWRRVITDVLLTRPSGDNASLARALAAAGLACHELPLLEIVPMPPDKSLIEDLDRFDRIIFISRNAVRLGLPALESRWPQWPVGLAWYAVGEATAGELEQFDVRPEVPARPDSDGVLALDSLQRVAGERVLIVRGEGGRETLRSALEDRGASVDYLEVYRRSSIEPDADSLAAVTSLLPLIAIVYSQSTLDSLVAAFGELTAQIHLVCPSERIAQAARECSFRSVRAADDAREDSLLQAVLDARS